MTRRARKELQQQGLVLPTRGEIPQEWQQTWDQLHDEGEAIAGAWMEDTGTAVVELSNRIATGWQRYYEAKRLGDDAAAQRVHDKIGVLHQQAWSLDSLARRLLMIRGLLALRSLVGDDITVTVESPRWRQRVRPDA